MLSPLEVFKKSWQVYQANFSVFLTVTIWLIIPALLVGALNYVDARLGRAFLNYSVPIYLILSALSYLLTLWVSVVLIRLIFNSLNHQPVKRRSLFQNAWRDTPGYFWVSLLVGLISFLGTLLVIIPGLIFTVWFFFSSTIFVLEGAKGTAALMASKKLVQNKFWPVLWQLIVTFGLYFLILIVLIGLPAYLLRYSGLSLEQNGQINWLLDLWSRLLIMLTLPLPKGFAVILYQELKKS